MSTDMSTEDLLRQLEDQRTAFLALEQRVHTALRQQEAARQQDESPSSPTFSDGIGRQSTVSFAEPSRKSTGIASLLQSSAMSVDSDDEDDETYYVFDVGPDGAPLSIDVDEEEEEGAQSKEALFWNTVKDVNVESGHRPAVGRILIAQEPAPVVFGALHYAMMEHFDMDELFLHLVNSEHSSHYVNGPEAFLATVLMEFRDARKRYEEIYKQITKMITPPPDFIFDEDQRDKRLFEDANFTYTRGYFWAHQTLGSINDSIKAMIDAYEDTFTEELFSGTSVLESRKSVELSEITILQGHNVKLLTLINIFFMRLWDDKHVD
ncbi:putative mg2+ transporter zinc transport protein [Neofusicoccum parvum UCRNP2]|uniref:Putative mg2+ transporter zinc transport protein n=1 Tax=Botryosphaeria parva (strain UCR-NP2) TaxID=1287680 RepID=R1EXQ4_BOTPV|nr:putative mg2+ transporter zinc transport protein [Neofusicoccum parvum UCRNP2]